MGFKSVVENGRILLPKKVMQKLGLKEGDEVIIRIGKVRGLPYAYIASWKAELIDHLL
ncbi:AbrB/MazE/SpoVT family DNA-binding domain-containing protein [Candidatus Bathyarchaeota archaeon]|nr:AbrB/MazE/SpoVT family DNA-binding domain-containing protein [Candidatus Bathyarchaeota archaeon]